MYWTQYTLFHISYLTTSLTWTTITRTWCDLIATIILKTKSFIETQLHVRTKKYSALGNKPRSPVHMSPTLTNELCELLLKDFKAQNNRIQNKFHIQKHKVFNISGRKWWEKMIDNYFLKQINFVTSDFWKFHRNQKTIIKSAWSSHIQNIWTMKQNRSCIKRACIMLNKKPLL